MAQNTTPPISSLIELAGIFVEQRKGVWDHEAWSGFLSDVQKKGFEMTDEMTAYLGSVLELQANPPTGRHSAGDVY